MRLSQTRNIADLRELALRKLPRPVKDYLEGGADDEVTLRANRKSFERVGLLPKALTDVSTVDPSTSLLGTRLKMPVILSPTGSSKLFHADGEMAVARAAERAGTFYSLSTLATSMLEDVAAATDAPKIFQIYAFRDRELTKEVIERCRASGYDALCLTVDCAVGGNRERDLLSGMSIPPSLSARSIIHFALRPQWSIPALLNFRFNFPNFDQPVSDGAKKQDTTALFNRLFDPSICWKDAEWLARIWNGKLIIKGLVRKDDVQNAIAIGARAVMISNHGGRQLDSMPAPMDVISEIRDAIGDGPELIVDGGVRRGTDVLKAIAAGANVCAIGRPYLYGLAAGGEAGVDRALMHFRDEIVRGMTLLGTPRIANIRREHLIQA